MRSTTCRPACLSFQGSTSIQLHSRAHFKVKELGSALSELASTHHAANAAFRRDGFSYYRGLAPAKVRA